METTAPTCQHCLLPVQWGRTTRGFAGFVHTATGSDNCDGSPLAADRIVMDITPAAR